MGGGRDGDAPPAATMARAQDDLYAHVRFPLYVCVPPSVAWLASQAST